MSARSGDDLARLVRIVVDRMAEVGYRELSCWVTETTLDRFVRFATTSGVTAASDVSEELAVAFVMAPGVDGRPSAVSTQHQRRSSLRVFFRVLHALDPATVDPTWALELPPRTSRANRPLTADELAVLRAVALSSTEETRRPAIVALAEAGAVTTEIGRVYREHVDLEAGTVRLGPSRHACERTVPLTEWGGVQLERRIAALTPADVPLAYAGGGRRGNAQASISTTLRQLFTRAGLTGEPDLALSSVRAWAGRRAFDASGRIEDAARILGTRTLDAAARIIDWDWRDP